MRKTAKQKAIVKVILEQMDKGNTLSPEELKVLVPHAEEISIQAFYCSLNILEKAGIILKEYKHAKLFKVVPTLKAYEEFR
jgi:Fe2+ or Zn2+ uptake regulation protein